MEKIFKRTLITASTLITCLPVHADELDDAANKIWGYYDGAANLMFAAAAIMGLIGALKVYGKFSRGDEDVYKAIGNWTGGCIFIALSAVLLKTFFG